MDLNDIFSSFFGFHGPRSFGHTEDDSECTDFFNTPPCFGSYGNQSHDDENNDDQDDMTFGQGHGGRFGGDLFFKFEEETQDVFRHFEEMFKSFGATEYPPSAFSRIDQEPSPPPSSSSRWQTPRDEMLKHPDDYHQDRLQSDPERHPMSKAPSWFSLWNPKPKWHWSMPPLPSTTPHKEDQDLDDQVKGGKLDEILTQRDSSSLPNTDPDPSPTSRSYFRSISVQTIRKPDGTVEQRRTETDADGNVTTTVTSTNPKEPATLPLAPDQRRRQADELARLKNDHTTLGEAETNSIFDKLFGSWGRR